MGFPYWPADKDPDAEKPFDINWASWLGTDTIITSTWIVPDSITKMSDSHTTTRTQIWLSGGIPGTTVTLTNRIVTAGGLKDDRSVKLKIKEL